MYVICSVILNYFKMCLQKYAVKSIVIVDGFVNKVTKGDNRWLINNGSVVTKGRQPLTDKQWISSNKRETTADW